MTAISNTTPFTDLIELYPAQNMAIRTLIASIRGLRPDADVVVRNIHPCAMVIFTYDAPVYNAAPVIAVDTWIFSPSGTIMGRTTQQLNKNGLI
jgi:hypothetical protein